MRLTILTSRPCVANLVTYPPELWGDEIFGCKPTYHALGYDPFMKVNLPHAIKFRGMCCKPGHVSRGIMGGRNLRTPPCGPWIQVYLAHQKQRRPGTLE